MTFICSQNPLRTDDDFNRMEYYPIHQNNQSPIIGSGISCIKQFSLDSMHLFYLGVVKRILFFLKEGPRICRLFHNQLSIISSRLEAMRNQLHSEFPRQPKGLKHLKRRKATEFKKFLLYTGLHALKGIVSKEMYDHFLAL